MLATVSFGPQSQDCEKSGPSRSRGWVICAVALTWLIGIVATHQWRSFAARKHHESMLVVIDACKTHLHRTKGDWPSGWEDIEPLCESIENWDVRRSIAIDFDANAGMLAFEHARDFKAVQPKFETNQSYRSKFSELIDVLREYHPPEMAWSQFPRVPGRPRTVVAVASLTRAGRTCTSDRSMTMTSNDDP